MALFRFLWLRRLIRRRTSPILESRAALWKSRLSILYAIIAWHAFGAVGYMIYTGKSDWAKHYGLKSNEEENLSPGHQWAKTLGIKEAKVYRIDGLSFEEVEAKKKEELVHS